MKKSIDGFYPSSYSSNSLKKINETYKDIHNKFPCLACNTKPVETKVEVSDRITPTFTIFRKKYCTKCWLKLVY